jgi:tripartite ATP-independent transporter DctM subunit
MSSQTLLSNPAEPLVAREWKVSCWFDRLENAILAGTLGLMIVLPLLEIVLRKTVHAGISGNSALVQHLVLLAGMSGAAIAARQNDLLSLSTLGTMLHGRVGDCARIFTNALSTAVTAFLAFASWQFIVTEQESGKTLVYHLPIWAIELAFPIGFAAIAARIIWQSSETWAGKSFTLSLASVFSVVAANTTAGFATTAALVLLAIAGVLGAPAFGILGGTALMLFWKIGQPIASIPIAHYSLVINPALPTLPLFTLAGYFLAEGEAPKRLIRVFDTIFGSLRGGPALVTVLVCAFFTSFTGASGVTILALGGLLIPLLKEANYSDRDALGLVTGTGSIGMLLPPCLPLIRYAVIARIPMEQIFLGGIIPGTILVLATAAWGMWKAEKVASRKRAPLKEILSALNQAKWELLLPVVAFVALFSGLATPVEAAALTALYALITQVFVHRDLGLRDLTRVMVDCGALIGGVLLILGVALGFTNYLVDAEVTDRVMAWVTASIHSRWAFLLVLNLFMWLIGCLMDIYSAIVVQVPLLVLLGAAYSIDPVHLGIIFLANLELGYLTPPVGLNLIFASTRFRKPIPEVLRSVVPIIAVFFAVVMLITYVPALTTTLPRWFACK